MRHLGLPLLFLRFFPVLNCVTWLQLCLFLLTHWFPSSIFCCLLKFMSKRHFFLWVQRQTLSLENHLHCRVFPYLLREIHYRLLFIINRWINLLLQAIYRIFQYFGPLVHNLLQFFPIKSCWGRSFIGLRRLRGTNWSFFRIVREK